MRTDFELDNEATGLTIHAGDLGGRSRAQVSDGLDIACREGRILPLSLDADNSLRVRVVVDEPLSDQEREEWVGHVAWWLDIADGRLTLEGGFDPQKPDADEDFLHVVDVAQGRCTVDVYAYLSGPNGARCVASAGLTESPLAWWRRVHGDEPAPGWFAEIFEDSWPDDEEWPEDDEEPRLIDYVVHVRTRADALPQAVPMLDGGWIPSDVGARVLPTCPRGIVAT